MSTKRMSAELSAKAGDEGSFLAVVSTYHQEPDLQGDVIEHGAFSRTIATWKASQNRLPLLWGHQWNDDPFSHLGWIERMEEVADLGLVVEGRLDPANPKAEYVRRLMKERRVVEFSIGYSVSGDRRRSDGATVLTDIELIEISVVLKGANQHTELIYAKAASERPARTPETFRAELLAKGLPADLVDVVFGVDPASVAEAERAAEREVALQKFRETNDLLSETWRLPSEAERAARIAGQVEREESERRARSADRSGRLWQADRP